MWPLAKCFNFCIQQGGSSYLVPVPTNLYMLVLSLVHLKSVHELQEVMSHSFVGQLGVVFCVKNAEKILHDDH